MARHECVRAKQIQNIMKKLIIILMTGLVALKAQAITSANAVRAIVGEAAGEPYAAKVAIAAVIRNRGSLKGVYGLHASHISYQPKWVFDHASRAWKDSAFVDPTNGCNMFGGKIDDSYFRSLGLKPVMTIGNTRFYKG